MNMPGMNGRDALVKIKQHPTFKSIPAVMFTTSNSIMDKEFAKKWGADFITKPVIYADLEDLAKTFVDRCDSEISKRA
jgi:CheY-like chemotaxis protein